MLRSPQLCSRVTLAESAACRIQQCSCGHVHLDLGPVSLRLQAAAVTELADTLAVAARSMRPSWLN